MSLVIRIGINDSPPVALLAAWRTSGGEDPDSLNTYTVTHFDTRGQTLRQVGDAVEVVHRYGDGAVILAQAALTAALAQDTA